MFFTALRRLGCVLAPATALTFAALATGPTVAQGEAATFAVTKTADTADGSCDSDCSLREAIIAANAAADQDTVTVPAGRYELTLPGWPDTAANGDLDIRGSVAIRGAGAPRTIVAGAFFNDEEEDVSVRDARVLETWAPRATSLAATISGLTMTGGTDGGLLNGARVGLRLSQVAIQGNGFPFGRHGYGGDGGGIGNSGRMEIHHSTISGNWSGGRALGGGIINWGALHLGNSTVSRNVASEGGGIVSGRSLTVRSSTIARNLASDGTGGGVYAYGPTFWNTIVARNQAFYDTPSNCDGPVRSLGHNLENGRSCGFTRASDVRADPRLGPLENNGGPTPTHRLMRGSPAIDAGGFPFPPTDQRGLVRPQGPASDIGAYERRASGPIPGGIPPSNPEECTHRGTSGNDILRGTPGNDVICGGAGNDVIYGLGGNDELRGGEGNDVLRGGGGNDKLNGSRGNDDLVGGDGEDRLTGGPGKDNLTGQGGRDSLDSRDDVRGNDVANGGPANDWCSTDPRDVRTSC